MYRAVKLEHLDVALNAVASKDPTPIADLSLRLAKDHAEGQDAVAHSERCGRQLQPTVASARLLQPLVSCVTC